MNNTERNTTLTGYNKPIFEPVKNYKSDDRLFGDMSFPISDIGGAYDKERALQIVNGLCADILFKAEYLEHPNFKSIPDCLEEPTTSKNKPKALKTHLEFIDTNKKALDSKFLEKSYTLDESTIEKPKPKKSRKRRNKKNRAQSKKKKK